MVLSSHRAKDPGRGSALKSLRLGGGKTWQKAHKGQPVLGRMGTDRPWRRSGTHSRRQDKHTGIRGDLYQASLASPPLSTCRIQPSLPTPVLTLGPTCHLSSGQGLPSLSSSPLRCVHSIQKIPVKSSFPSYHCSSQCPRVVPVSSHTCRLSLMQPPYPHTVLPLALKHSPGWDGTPSPQV